MKPTPEQEAKGGTAYEQVRAFERVRTWRLPASHAVLVLIPLLIGAGAWWLGHPVILWFGAIVAVSNALVSVWQWRRLRARHEQNLALLEDLRKTCGDELPWVRMEQHFAALDDLKREIAAEKQRSAGGESAAPSPD